MTMVRGCADSESTGSAGRHLQRPGTRYGADYGTRQIDAAPGPVPACRGPSLARRALQHQHGVFDDTVVRRTAVNQVVGAVRVAVRLRQEVVDVDEPPVTTPRDDPAVPIPCQHQPAELRRHGAERPAERAWRETIHPLVTQVQEHLLKADILVLDLRLLIPKNREKLMNYISTMPTEQRRRFAFIL